MASLSHLRELLAAAEAAAAAAELTAKLAAALAAGARECLSAAEEALPDTSAEDVGEEGGVKSGEIKRLRAQVEYERGRNQAVNVELTTCKGNLAMCQADLSDLQSNLLQIWEEEDAEELEATEPDSAASAGSPEPAHGAKRPRSPEVPPDKRRDCSRSRLPAAELHGPVWVRRGGRRSPAGYKVILQDLPACWAGGDQLAPWLQDRDVKWTAISEMELSPAKRWQVILTLKTQEDAWHAKGALAGHRLEVGKHTSTAKFWMPMRR